MYKGGLKDVLHGEETASFTTFDAALRFTPVRSGGLLSGLEFDVPMQVGFLLSPASYKGMSAHVSVRFLLLVIGVFTLGGCDATSTAVDKAMATPHRLIRSEAHTSELQSLLR